MQKKQPHESAVFFQLHNGNSLRKQDEKYQGAGNKMPGECVYTNIAGVFFFLAAPGYCRAGILLN
ncbi:MAG: hypothetical protein B7Y56_02305 [Gallionellales bacterium 35-53-114]|nr:MAG: hypothetical protein B7Y56_02305 [Gallionellales bacterium 35-53-114]OYZ64451.1 MAG: hypothetical protein B7Y04_06085 [Gallionellales bacterium 24-53-125]OZB10245.1 MAG: hypothetical protein B7X61_01625 [Gallionellales bacterium 39-52-133]